MRFFLLKLVDAIFYGPLADELMNEDGLVLADTVSAVGCLIFGRRVPPRIVVNDSICCGEIEASAARFERDEENRDGGILELFHHVAAIF